MADTQLKNEILKSAKELFKTQVNWRRHLHQHPELSNQEFKTTAYIKAQLKKLGLKLLPLKMETGVLAEVVGSSKGKTIAIRSDIDALPILEKTGLPFKSKNIGCMHACGHDVHMATVMGAAALLQKNRDKMTGSVRFLFQPAEEKPPGGARPMIANGALSGVKMILGLHVDPNLAVGRIGLRDGATMASVCDFNLIVRGKGGHAARPHSAVDAIVIAAEIVESLQKVVSRETDPISPVAITFGQISGGTARNVIANEVTLVGTARTLSKKNARDVPRLIQRTARAIAKAHGGTVEYELVAGYPVLSNHKSANRLIAESFAELYGRRSIEETPYGLGGEDFACYLEKVPGAMFRLGIMNKKIGADKGWHSDQFMVDESAITVGSSVLALSAMNFLQKK